MATEERHGGRAIVLLSLLLTVAASLPLFLLGAVAVQMRRDLAFGVAALGVAAAAFRLTGALLAPRIGRVIDGLGPVPAMRFAVVLSTLASLAIATIVRSWGPLVVAMAVSGAASSVAQAAANVSLVRAVRDDQQGFAFALKQSALPAASALAGLAVPVIVVGYGWRAAYALAALTALLVSLIIPKASDDRLRLRLDPVHAHPLGREVWYLVIGMFFAMSAATTLSSFTIDSAVAAGVPPARAGLLLTIGSALSIAVRLVVGARADRREGGHIGVVARLILLGSLGYLLMGLQTTWGITIGMLVAYGLGWGFNGLFAFAVVRLYRAVPGAATGRALAAGSSGGLFGPFVFGFVAEWAGYRVAWPLAAGWALIGSFVMVLGRRRISALRAGAPPSELP